MRGEKILADPTAHFTSLTIASHGNSTKACPFIFPFITLTRGWMRIQPNTAIKSSSVTAWCKFFKNNTCIGTESMEWNGDS